MQPEPVSPELVLVDPELARRERARLEEKAYLQSVLEMAPLRRAVENLPSPVEETDLPSPVEETDLPSPVDETDLPAAVEEAELPSPVEEIAHRRPWHDAAAFSRRRLVPAALMCSLLVNGFLVADLVAGKGDEATQVAIRMVTLTQTAASVGSPTVPPASAVLTEVQKVRRATASKVSVEKGAVERRIVSLILLAPARKLPRDFIDPNTGLVKNNVQVVCNRRKQSSFLCAVRAPSHGTSKALYVRYRTSKNGDGVFTWYGYRRN